MWEAGRAARTERAQAAKRGLSWSGGEGDGDARDEHDECGAGSERSGVGGNGDAFPDGFWLKPPDEKTHGKGGNP